MFSSIGSENFVPSASKENIVFSGFTAANIK
jgi:hypothetical protein